MSTLDRFLLTGRTAVITGGAGLLGRQHARAILDAGGKAALLDISDDKLASAVAALDKEGAGYVAGFVCDITSPESIRATLDAVLARFGGVQILINNAANDPKVGGGGLESTGRLEHFPLAGWNADLAVGLTGAFLCTQVFGTHMASSGTGTILNIASDLGLIGPDQRIYRQDGLPEEMQPAKPVTYSVVKSGLIGLTRYTATYWAKAGLRCNALCPGGVYANQDAAFVERLTNLIPMGRMANADEYAAAIVFLVSDASAYMTGAIIAMEGGRTAW